MCTAAAGGAAARRVAALLFWLLLAVPLGIIIAAGRGLNHVGRTPT
jgi:hypothetical protein